MVTWQKWAVAGAVAAIAIGSVYILSPSREARIKKQLAILVDHISKSPGQNQLVTAANAKRIRTVFTATLTLHAPAYDYSRDLAAAEIPALVLTATAPYSELTLSFHDLAFQFPSEGEARVRATARVRGRLSGGEWIEDIQELNCRFLVSDDGWRLAAVEFVDVLQK